MNSPKPTSEVASVELQSPETGDHAIATAGIDTSDQMMAIKRLRRAAQLYAKAVLRA